MKPLLLLIFTILTIKCFSQDDTVKRNSIFKTFEEFKNNKPSIYPVIFVIDTSNKNEPKLKYFDSSGELKKMNNSFWGFSDSSYVYITHDGFYGRFIEIGNICVFKYHFVIDYYTNNFWPKKNIVRIQEGNKAYVLFSKTGDIMELTTKNMKKILKDDPVLLKQFEAEEIPDEEKLEYIRKYNELHPLNH